MKTGNIVRWTLGPDACEKNGNTPKIGRIVGRLSRNFERGPMGQNR